MHLARSGDRPRGIARLRDLAARTVLAATELVDLADKDQGTEEAIAECERQRERWRHDPGLSRRHATLLGRAGRDDEAAKLVESLVSDQAIPAGDRIRLCNWLAARKVTAGDFAGAERAARDGLAIGTDAPLAWTLIRVLLGAGRIIPAREALARHRPAPETDDEARVWFELHLAVPLAGDSARVLLALAAEHPAVLPPGDVLPVLRREAILARNAGQPYPPDLLAAIDDLAAGQDPAQRAGYAPGLAAVPESVQHVIARVQNGLAAQADITTEAGVPYGAVLLHRDAGMLPAADLSPMMRSAGEDAAAAALDCGGCVADLSAVHTLQLLPDRARLAACWPPFKVSVIWLVASLPVSVVFVVVLVAVGWRATTP